MSKPSVNRRAFIAGTAAAGAAMSLPAASYGKVLHANDTLRVGFLGVGGRCQQHIDVILQMQKEYKTDAKRVYLTGLSMGGYGTWSLAAAHPEKWAAIAPICGGANAKDVETIAGKVKDIPCWCFHGDADTAVKVEQSRTLIDALKKAGGTPKYTEYPKVGHNSWDAAYGDKEFFPWLLEQKRK